MERIHILSRNIRPFGSVKKKHTLSIASTIRQDIIDPLLGIHKLRFDNVMAKTLDLIYSKSQLVEKISKVSKVDFMVGDRKEDMDAGTKVKARTVFVSWGAQSDVQVDFYISSPQQLLKILK